MPSERGCRVGTWCSLLLATRSEMCKHIRMGQTETCAVCRVNPSTTGQGEHVWPQWFLRAMDALGPPKSPWAVNSVPVLNQRGRPIRHPVRQRVFLPACSACNTELNVRFERPALAAVKALASNAWVGKVGREDWQAIGMWWVKVLLMLGNPRAKMADDQLNSVAVRFDDAPPDYTWMVNGSAPPSDMSLWVFNGTMAKSHPEFTLVLPSTVTMLDGANSLCHELSLATPGLCVTAVSHPGISIDHPLEKRQDAWELLHSPPQEGDLSQLRALPYNTVAWVRGGKVPHGHRVGPDQTSQLMAMFEYEADEVQPG